MRVVLEIINGPKMGKTFEYSRPVTAVIGRAADAGIRLTFDEDEYLSRRHVLLEVCPPTCWLHDLGSDGLGSTNPPKVNGVLVEEVQLQSGDVFEVGYTRFRVTIDRTMTALEKACSNCGASIEYLEGDSQPDLCEACLGRLTIPLVKCWNCGRDMSLRANGDGRAEELSGSGVNGLVYSCEACLPPGDTFASTTIGLYEIVRCIGSGNMGTVFLVYERRTGRMLALKQIKGLGEPLLIRRFQREVRLLKGLKHRNVVRFVDAGADAAGNPFLVTEFVPGGDLEHYIWERLEPGPRRVADIRDIVLGILDGVEYLHRNRIIHRDLKPSNVLLSGPGRPGRGDSPLISRIADFGVAVCYGEAGGTRFTGQGARMGTLMYMSPEQILDSSRVKEQADLYSVGVILYYLLTSRYTFEFPTPREIAEFQDPAKGINSPGDALRAFMQAKKIRDPLKIILEDEPIPVAQRDRSIPEKLASVVDKAVKKDPSGRFQSASEFRNALKGAF